MKLDKIDGSKLQILFKIRKCQQKEVASALDFKEKSFNNKIRGGNFTAAELIKIAEYTNTYLAFIDKNNGEALVKFSYDDLKAKEEKDV